MKWLTDVFRSRASKVPTYNFSTAMDALARNASADHRIAAANVIAKFAAAGDDERIKLTMLNMLLIHLCFDKSDAVAHACLEVARAVDPAWTKTQIVRARTMLASAGPSSLSEGLGFHNVMGSSDVYLSMTAAASRTPSRLKL